LPFLDSRSPIGVEDKLRGNDMDECVRLLASFARLAALPEYKEIRVVRVGLMARPRQRRV